MKSRKGKIITTIIIIVGILLIIGSFFLRDMLLRAGIAEFERKEILQVKTKYADTLQKIADRGLEKLPFEISAHHGGINEKSKITADDEYAKAIYEDLKEEIDVLCHGYCYRISGRSGAVFFDFNGTGTKQLIFSNDEPEKLDEDDVLEALGDGWYYYEVQGN